MTRTRLFHVIPILSFAVMSSCRLEYTSPLIVVPDVPLEDLLGAPAQVQINNLSFKFEASLNRDFMPMSPPDGQPLSAFVRVIEVDSSDVQPGVNASFIWVVYETQVWSSYLTDENVHEESYELLRYAHGGPKWGPDVFADVIVGMTDLEGILYLMKQEDVLIGQTW